MKITISGPPGSGKTTVAKLLSEKLKVKLISAGEVFRQLAFDRGMGLEDFSRFAESNPEIDIMIDRVQRELAEKEKEAIVEGRLSGWMIRDADLKVYIFADPEVRYSRIAKREGKDISTVKRETKLREEIEKRRYHKFYSIDLEDWRIYDLIINSSRFPPEKIVEMILVAIR
ncbi:MAG: AAA family ATPase [Archaeoglobales archaeon]|nr:AAA family ATPase [Archaeoglobales archaeon]